MEATTLMEILRARATRTPDREALTFLKSSSDAERVSYAELDRGARLVAASLQQYGQPGDRVLLLCPPGRIFVEAFLGVLYAGRVAVPASPITGKRDQSRLSELVRRARPSVICAFAQQAPRVERWLRDQPERAQWSVLYLGEPVELDGTSSSAGRLDVLGPEHWEPPKLRPNQLALLQFTSGSIGSPKGVMIEHGQLLHNLQQIARAFELTEDRRGVIWLPPYHDMGLIGGVLSPLESGFPVTLLSPVDFLRRPLLWLETITRYQATGSGGPGFAYDLCVKHVSDEALATLDLSTWQVAFVGAEPIQESVLRRFERRFAGAGFNPRSWRPCYGLAESVLMVTSAEAHDALTVANAPAAASSAPVFAGARAGKAVSCGAPQGARVVIVDAATGSPVDDGQVGELWVQGPSVARGYWEQPAETRATFGARLTSGEGPFLRTGDLAFQHAGKVFIHGRAKEVIIVAGRNIYPTDVEYAALQVVEGARPNSAAAFSVTTDGHEGIVLVQEVPDARTTPQQVAVWDARVREAVAAAIGVELRELLWVAPNTVPKTTSGKVQRVTCKDRFERAELKPVAGNAGLDPHGAELPRAGDTRRWVSLVCGLLAEQLGLDVGQVDSDATFADSGCDSKGIAALQAKLAGTLGRRLDADLMYRRPTPRALGAHLASEHGLAAHAPERTRSVELEPIAIVGLACKVPGAHDASAFWELLCDARDAVRCVPEERWDRQRWLREGRSGHGTIYTDRMGCIDAPYAFDAKFFGIDERAALALDPQQRLILEQCWNALEDAHIPPSTLAQRDVGVFMGATHSDYAQLARSHGAITSQTAPGNALSAISGRVSYLLGLQGPAITLDTACSSSLVAIHTACHYLRSGECELALCGGVNLVLAPETTAALCRMRALSPRGKSAVFDESADGYVRGEGAGVVVLKRLSHALANGDRIYACIAGSAVNQDGRSNGFTAPHADAQEAVIRRALTQAGSRVAAAVSYVEAHGTGTRLGDPIEVCALARAYACVRSAAAPLRIGSVKSNIGHLEAAAGVVGLIKVALAIHNARLPASVNCPRPSELVPWRELGARVVDRTEDWLASQGLLAAGVSSFGFTGTNAHAIVTSAPTQPLACAARSGPQLFCLSARSETALHEQIIAYRRWLAQHPHTPLSALCANLALGRDHHRIRYAVVVEDVTELTARLARAPGDSDMTALETSSHDDRAQLYSVAERYNAGDSIDWSALFPERPNLQVSLPGYAFDARTYRYPNSSQPLTSNVEAT